MISLQELRKQTVTMETQQSVSAIAAVSTADSIRRRGIQRKKHFKMENERKKYYQYKKNIIKKKKKREVFFF